MTQTTPAYSLQETFDLVVSHLRSQGCKAVNPVGHNCVYRTSEGLKCAAGCLIPDSLYDSNFEETSIFVEDDQQFNAVSRVVLKLGHDLLLVKKLQSIHDNYNVETWEYHFNRVAKEFGLKYAPAGEKNTETVT